MILDSKGAEENEYEWMILCALVFLFHEFK